MKYDKPLKMQKKLIPAKITYPATKSLEIDIMN